MRLVPHYRAICPEPGPMDAFIVIFINGKRVGINHASDYPQISAAAERVAVEQRCHVKVIPITPEEVMPFLNIKPGDPSQMEPGIRALDMKSCLDVLFECGSGDDNENVLRRLEAPQ